MVKGTNINYFHKIYHAFKCHKEYHIFCCTWASVCAVTYNQTTINYKGHLKKCINNTYTEQNASMVLNMTTEAESWTVWASMNTHIKLDTALNLNSD